MIDFSHLGRPVDAAVIGASGGLGQAFVRALAGLDGIGRVHALSRSGRVPEAEGVVPGRIDVTDEASIEAAAGAIGEDAGLRLVICAVGLLHADDHFPEKTWRDLTAAGFARSYAINATGPALVAKHFLPLIPRREPAVFAALSARVGSISDNKAGGWYSYRASKAALNQILTCLAIEEGRRRRELVITGLQPGTVKTELSEPFRGFVKEEDLFEPDEAAEHLLGVLSRLGPEQSGRLFDWRGEAFAP
ncbi:MAG: SDR family NAD(P)-dependent oxidoreductase [Paracoccaceae bacterium]